MAKAICKCSVDPWNGPCDACRTKARAALLSPRCCPLRAAGCWGAHEYRCHECPDYEPNRLTKQEQANDHSPLRSSPCESAST
jgi:hypothetical protein